MTEENLGTYAFEREFPMKTIQRVGIVVAALLATAPSAHAAFPGANGAIAFEGSDNPSCRSSYSVLFSLRAAVGEPCSLEDVRSVRPDDDSRATTLLLRRAANPAFSSSGRQLVFEDRDGRGLKVAAADGRDVRRLTRGRRGTDDVKPAWSPSGRYVVFERGGNLFRVRRDGRRLRRLTRRGGKGPAWSRSGRIAFTRRGNLYVISRSGRRVSRLTRSGSDSNPNWSPRGTRLIFERGDDVYVVKLNGTGLRRVAEFGRGPVWSPDGRFFAFGVTDRVGPPGAEEEVTSVEIQRGDSTGGRTVASPGLAPDWQPRPRPQARD